MNRTETRPVGGSGADRVLESWKLAGTLVRFAELLLEFSEKGDVSGVGAEDAWAPGFRVVAVSPAAWRISWQSWPE